MKAYTRFLAARGLAGTTVNQIVILFAGIGSGITLARSLGPGGRGELAIVLLWSSILVLLGDLGLGFAYAYYAGKEKDRIDEVWTLCLLTGGSIGAVLALAGWVIIPSFVPALRSTRGEFAWAVLSIPVVLTSGFEAYLLLGRGLIEDYNRVRFTTSFAYLVYVVFAALLAATIRVFVIAYFLAQLTGLITSTFIVLKRFRPRLRFDRQLLMRVFSYGTKAQLASIAAQANLRADQSVMSIMLAPGQLGLYVVAVSIGGILTPLMNAVAVVVLPRTTHATSATNGLLVVARYLKLACLVSAPVLLISIALTPWVMPILFGRAFMPATASARILTVAGLFQGMNGVLGNSLRGLGRPGLPAIAEGVGMLVTILMLFLLLPPFGMAGAAIASLLAYVLVTVMQFAFVARAGGINSGRLLVTSITVPVLEQPKHFIRTFFKSARVTAGLDAK